MPYRDGMGPMGAGPMSGRGFGYCRAGAGFGRGFGMGIGYGWRAGAWEMAPYTLNQVYASNPVYAPTVENQRQALLNEQKFLEGRLEALQAQINALQNSSSDTP